MCSPPQILRIAAGCNGARLPHNRSESPAETPHAEEQRDHRRPGAAASGTRRGLIEAARTGGHRTLRAALAVSRNINIDVEKSSTFGERLADQVAAVGGSWKFIIGFGVFILLWSVINTVLLATHAFDPYPFIFLNLTLSMLAAVQAPLILMSQNRAAARDRIVANHDYEVNLKAEIEIAALHEKLDQIRSQELATMIQRLTAEVVKRG